MAGLHLPNKSWGEPLCQIQVGPHQSFREGALDCVLPAPKGLSSMVLGEATKVRMKWEGENPAQLGMQVGAASMLCF